MVHKNDSSHLVRQPRESGLLTTHCSEILKLYSFCSDTSGELCTGNSELGSKPETFSKRAKPLRDIHTQPAHEPPTFNKAGSLSSSNLEATDYVQPVIMFLPSILLRQSLAWALIPFHPPSSFSINYRAMSTETSPQTMS